MGGYLATKYLIDNGHRDIVMFSTVYPALLIGLRMRLTRRELRYVRSTSFIS